MIKNVAYMRVLVGGSSYTSEWVNGCPSILLNGEPDSVVVRNDVGNLIAYYHFKNNDYRGSI